MSAKRLTLSAFFMALVVILSSSLLSIPVPGGHFYFNGIIIFLVGLIFPPMDAVIIAGVGSFIGDFLFYPLPMWVTLATHSLQVLAISLVVGGRLGKLSKPRAVFRSLAWGNYQPTWLWFWKSLYLWHTSLCYDENSF